MSGCRDDPGHKPTSLFSERPQMKSLGDDHRGHAQGQPDEKKRQEPADPFLSRDLEDAQGGPEIAVYSFRLNGPRVT